MITVDHNWPIRRYLAPSVVATAIEDALAEREQLGEHLDALQRIFGDDQFADCCMYAKDITGRMLMTNRAYDEMLATTDAPVGRMYSEVLTPEMERVARSTDEMILSGCRKARYEHTTPLPSGEVVHFVSYKFPLLNHQQNVLGMVGFSAPAPRELNGTTERSSLDLSQSAEQLRRLSPRELQVLEMVCQGRMNKVIARELDVSVRTIEASRARVMEKLGVKSPADLIKLAVRLSDAGLVTLDI